MAEKTASVHVSRILAQARRPHANRGRRARAPPGARRGLSAPNVGSPCRGGRTDVRLACARMESIGFLGLGIMGSRMAANLRRAGHELTVFNRTRERAEAFAQEHGATVADTPAEVGAASDIVITMVVDGDQVRELLLGEDGVATSAADGALCVDMSTIAPGQARAMAGRARANAASASSTRPSPGSSPKAAGRHADDHGRRRRRALRARQAAVRGDGRADPARRRDADRARRSSSSTTPSPRRTPARWPRRWSSAAGWAPTSTPSCR